MRIKLNEEIALHPARRNFVALMQGNSGKSYKGITFSLLNTNGGSYFRSESLPPVILPIQGEKREVEKWSTSAGDVSQKPPMNDFSYAGFDISLDIFWSNSPKLGEVFYEDLQLLKDIKNDVKVFDCGVNIA